LRIAILEKIPEDPTLRTQWNELVLRLPDSQVFYTYEWSLAVQRAYQATLHPLVFLGFDETGSLCALVSLALDSERTRAFFLCATTGDYCDFLAAGEHKGAFVSSVVGHLRQRGIGEITLANLPSDSTTVGAIEQISAETGYRWFARTAYICAQVRLGQIERRPGDNKLALPGRKMVRRSLSAMGRESPVRLDHVCDWDAVARMLPEFVEAHIARFSATGRVSNLADPVRQLFIEELAKLLASSGWLVLTRMMTGEKVLAWNYGFRFQGSWFWYQPTFETDLERFSPGFCLLSKLIEEAAEDPALKVVDLGLGAEEYKERFANESRRTLYVTLRRSLAKHVKEVLRYGAAEAIKTSPPLERSARKVVSRIRALGKSNKK
jgi:CelD/BcsL family acetyltransferase involved in cellulose biosynthesis